MCLFCFKIEWEKVLSSWGREEKNQFKWEKKRRNSEKKTSWFSSSV